MLSPYRGVGGGGANDKQRHHPQLRRAPQKTYNPKSKPQSLKQNHHQRRLQGQRGWIQQQQHHHHHHHGNNSNSNNNSSANTKAILYGIVSILACSYWIFGLLLPPSAPEQQQQSRQQVILPPPSSSLSRTTVIGTIASTTLAPTPTTIKTIPPISMPDLTQQSNQKGQKKSTKTMMSMGMRMAKTQDKKNQGKKMSRKIPSSKLQQRMSMTRKKQQQQKGKDNENSVHQNKNRETTSSKQKKTRGTLTTNSLTVLQKDDNNNSTSNNVVDVTLTDAPLLEKQDTMTIISNGSNLTTNSTFLDENSVDVIQSPLSGNDTDLTENDNNNNNRSDTTIVFSFPTAKQDDENKNTESSSIEDGNSTQTIDEFSIFSLQQEQQQGMNANFSNPTNESTTPNELVYFNSLNDTSNISMVTFVSNESSSLSVLTAHDLIPTAASTSPQDENSSSPPLLLSNTSSFPLTATYDNDTSITADTVTNNSSSSPHSLLYTFGNQTWTLEEMNEWVNRTAKAWPIWSMARNQEEELHPYQWCQTKQQQQQKRASGGGDVGLLYIKVPKCASTTAMGVTLRIADTLGRRVLQDNNTENNENQECFARYRHGPASSRGRKSKLRDWSSSLLWTLIRQPRDRYLSHYFFEQVSRRRQANNATFDDDDSSEVTLMMEQDILNDLKNQPDRKKSFLLHYLKLSSPQQEQSFFNLISEIMNHYDFIGSSDRMDESLVALSMILQIPTADVVVLSSKLPGMYDAGRSKAGCTKLISKYSTPQIDEYFTDIDWTQRNNWDELLYRIIDVSLDKTIQQLGLAPFGRKLNMFRKYTRQIQEQCRAEAIFPCQEQVFDNTTNATATRMNSTATSLAELAQESCYFADAGCGHKCIDRVLGNVSNAVWNDIQNNRAKRANKTNENWVIKGKKQVNDGNQTYTKIKGKNGKFSRSSLSLKNSSSSKSYSTNATTASLENNSTGVKQKQKTPHSKTAMNQFLKGLSSSLSRKKKWSNASLPIEQNMTVGKQNSTKFPAKRSKSKLFGPFDNLIRSRNSTKKSRKVNQTTTATKPPAKTKPPKSIFFGLLREPSTTISTPSRKEAKAVKSAIGNTLPKENDEQSLQDDALQQGRSKAFPQWLNDYFSYHRKSLVADGKKKKKSQQNQLKLKPNTKYLVYQCHGSCAGLGGRLKGIIKSFYVAVCTQRVFLIDSPFPLPLQDYLKPNRIHWNAKFPNKNNETSTKSRQGKKGSMEQQEQQTLDIFFRSNKDKSKRVQVPSFVEGIEIAKAHGKEMVDLRQIFETEACEAFDKQHKISSSLSHQSEEDFYTWGFHALFMFSKQVQDRAVVIKQQAGIVTDRPYVGLHLRMGGDGTWKESSNNMIKRLRQIHGQGVKPFFKCYSLYRKQHLFMQGYIASDSSKHKKELLKLDRDSTLKSLESVDIFHIDRSIAAKQDNDKNNNDKTAAMVQQGQGMLDLFAELKILADAKCIIMSQSGLSFAAHYIGTHQRCGIQVSECAAKTVEKVYTNYTQSLNKLVELI